MRPQPKSEPLGESLICRGVSAWPVGWRGLILGRAQTVAGTFSGTFWGAARSGWSGASSCGLRSHNEIDVSVENLQQGHELVDGLTVIRLIHEPIELGRRSPESADDLTLRHGGSLRTPAHVINLVFWHVTPSPREL